MTTNAYKTTLIDTSTVAEKTRSITLEKPAGFSFKSGQHIGVKILNPPVSDEKGNVRTLSIASAPEEENLLLATRLSDSAFKESIQQINRGATFEIDGPYGSMTLEKNTDMPAVCLAGGIGITPFLSMVRHLKATDGDRQLYLFNSNRTPKDAPFFESIEDMAKQLDDIVHIPTMTRPEAIEAEWNGTTGYITNEMIRGEVKSPKESMFYIAGPDAFVKAMEELLLQMEVPQAQVGSEVFAGY